MIDPETANDLGTIGSIITASGAVGITAFGLVDTLKAAWGGPSRFGFVYVRDAVKVLLPGDTHLALKVEEINATLLANWINGVAKPEQKATAKSLIRLCITEETAGEMADKVGLDGKAFAELAGAVAKGAALTPEQLELLGRFDVVVSAKLDAAYERGDQLYRNANKALAAGLGLALALVAARLADMDMGQAFLIGLLSAPLAPVSKDVASALSSVVQTLKAVKK